LIPFFSYMAIRVSSKTSIYFDGCLFLLFGLHIIFNGLLIAAEISNIVLCIFTSFLEQFTPKSSWMVFGSNKFSANFQEFSWFFSKIWSFWPFFVWKSRNCSKKLVNVFWPNNKPFTSFLEQRQPVHFCSKKLVNGLLLEVGGVWGGGEKVHELFGAI